MVSGRPASKALDCKVGVALHSWSHETVLTDEDVVGGERVKDGWCGWLDGHCEDLLM